MQREERAEGRKGGSSPKPEAQAHLSLFATGFVFVFGRTTKARGGDGCGVQ